MPNSTDLHTYSILFSLFQQQLHGDEERVCLYVFGTANQIGSGKVRYTYMSLPVATANKHRHTHTRLVLEGVGDDHVGCFGFGSAKLGALLVFFGSSCLILIIISLVDGF
ncbi:hypothetical protein Droror1_Dr00019057 [Drosera rotundifolia]